METVYIDLTLVEQALITKKNVVTEDHFGSIYTTFLTLQNYDKSLSGVNVGSIRWPGGSVAEADATKYSLTYPDIYNTDIRDDRGLSDVLLYANEKNLAFSMVLPTVCYMDNVSQGIAEVEEFLIRLLAGDFGLMPDDFTLEIGNETSHYGWSNGVFTPGVGSYGYIANEFLTVINGVLADPVLNPWGVEIKVAVQMSTTVGGQDSIFSQITPENLRTVDGFIRHSGLVLNADDFDVAFENDKVDALTDWWAKAWNGDAPELNILDTAWALGPSDPIPADAPSYDIGVKQAAAVIEVFSKLIATGSDTAAIWGVQNNPSSMFYYEGQTVSYGGEAFRLMAECLTGMTLVDGKIDANGDWVEFGTNWDCVTYADSEQVVIFVYAGDIPEDGLSLAIDLQGISAVSFAWAEVISSTIPTDPQRVIISEATSPGGPIVSQMPVTINGTTISVELTSDYEVVRIIAERVPEVNGLYLLGSAGADSLTGGALADVLDGGAGDDLLNGQTGNDTMLGGSGNDTFVVDAAGDMVLETITFNSAADAGGNDVVKSNVNFSLDAYAGVRFVENLTLTGSSAITGTGNALANQLTGNSGDNTLNGLDGNDGLNGWAGNDVLYGGSGMDTLYGDAGNDTLDGGTGNDTMSGGAGNDAFIVDAVGDRVFETTSLTNTVDAGGVDIVQSSVSFSLDASAGARFVENLTLTGSSAITGTGNALANQLTGNSGNNTLNGLGGNDGLNGWAGNDVLYGGSGMDTLYGDAGNDTLDGGTGNDTISGGAGNDTFIVDAAGDRVFETTSLINTVDSGGVDIVKSSVSFSLDAFAGVRFVENLILTGSSAITGTGNALANQLTGNSGNNTLNGLGGNDVLGGWAGNDVLYGGSGSDAISGDNGSDILYGGTGNDTMTGGAGFDTFVFDLAPTPSDVDSIKDFSVVDDIINLFSEPFGRLTSGTLAAASFSANVSGTAQDASDRIVYETDTGRLYFDADGTGSMASVHFATLAANLAITNADFFVF